jgi:membrane-associated phospholipid phosphatase
MYTVSFIYDKLGDKKKAGIIKGLAILWVALVMFSRMVCGAHFLSDTCAGAIITMTIVIVCRKIFCKDTKSL